MLPLLQAMDHPCRTDQVRIGIINQNEINAANAGSCEFYVTMGLLRRANDDQLRGVLAHEIAHQDLGHVAKAQVLGAGLNIGAAVLQQLFPAAGVLAPIAGELVARGYGRTEEYAADRHGVDILRRAGYSKETMLDALTWVRSVAGKELTSKRTTESLGQPELLVLWVGQPVCDLEISVSVTRRIEVNMYRVKVDCR